MCVQRFVGVAGRSNRRLQYCQSGPIPLAWVARVPIGTRIGLVWIAAGGIQGIEPLRWMATSHVWPLRDPVFTVTDAITVYYWQSTPRRG